jgi:anti-sigma B factor antagonist
MTHDVTVANPGRFMPTGSITTTAQDDWRASVELRGEFDAANAAELRAVFDEHLDAGRRVLRIDTHAVTFMDSSAVGAIVATHARCNQEHGSLILTGVQPRVARLFQITGLDHVLLIDSAGDNGPAASTDGAADAEPVRRHPL